MKASLKIFISFYFFFSAVNTSIALPEGTEAIEGGGSFEISGKIMTVDAPDGSIFEHQSFNIAGDESIQFIQPSSESRVLNRIIEPSPSIIDGSIIANGELYLVNPAGVIFGEGALVEAPRLHAVAGTLSNNDFIDAFDNFTSLESKVENKGIINADHITLGGSTVVNSGTLNAPAGNVVLTAGGSMTMTRTDGFLTVSISPDSTVPVGVATDLIGQTLLNSGILNSKEAHLSGNEITNNGTIDSEKIVMSEFSLATSPNGLLKTNELILIGSAEDAELNNQNDLPKISIESYTNQVSNILLTGNFDQISLANSVETRVDQLTGAESLGFTKIQNGEFKVSGKNLTIGYSFSPVFSFQSASIILATDEELHFESNLQNLVNSYQGVFYGKNLDPSLLQGLETIPANLYPMNASSLDVDDLSIGLDVDSVIKLSLENPSSDAFSYDGKDHFEIPLIESEQTADNGIFPVTPSNDVPAGPLIEEPSSQPSSSPVDNAINSLPFPMVSEDRTFSSEQLEAAMDHGLFGNHSYFLLSLSGESYMIKKITDSGGSSSVFGGSFALAESATTSSVSSSVDQQVSSVEESSMSSSEETVEAEGDENTDEGGEENVASNQETSEDRTSPTTQSRQKIGAAPFSPISAPVLSPQAANILESALNANVQGTLQNYLNR